MVCCAEYLVGANSASTSASEQTQERFLQSYENTYGVSFDSRCNWPNYSVSIETHYPDKTAEAVGVVTGTLGLIFGELTDPTISKFMSFLCGVISAASGLISSFSSDTEYQMYVVDIWHVVEWKQYSDGRWKGTVCGEKHMFRIYYDSSSGETLEYLGAMDLTDHSRYATMPSSDPGPCYQYYCSTDQKGVYR